MSREKLELVTEFGSLKAGDLVVVRPHVPGWKDHRCMLVRMTTHWLSGEPSWVVLPKHIDTLADCLLTPAFVDRRQVYRVVIPPAEEARETARPKQLERVK
jgi:hypothetical protein